MGAISRLFDCLLNLEGQRIKTLINATIRVIIYLIRSVYNWIHNRIEKGYAYRNCKRQLLQIPEVVKIVVANPADDF